MPSTIKVNIKGDIITLFQRKGIWYADFRRVGGGRPTLETGNKTYAIRIAEKMYEKFAEVKYGIKGDLNIGQVMDKFMKYSRDMKSSWMSDVGRIKNILEHFPRNTFLKNIKKSHVEEFENHLK